MTTTRSEDQLIGRIASNDADQIDWSQFEQQASTDHVAWERLARTLRDELQMRCALDEVLAPGDDTPVPDEAFEPQLINFGPGTTRWSGWAIAAMIGIVWIGSVFFGSPQQGAGLETNIGPRVSFDTPDKAYNEYMRLGAQRGVVLEELPNVLVEYRAIGVGAQGKQMFEVYFVRQTLERRRINSAYEMSRDELGRRVPVRMDFASYQPDSDL